VTASDALTGEPARLLDASTVEADHDKGTLHVLCPAGTAFDAAEALRLQLVDRAPCGGVVDVEIAPSEPATLSPEDEAGARLFASQRAERIAGVGTCGTPGCYCRAPGGWPRDLRCADCRDVPEYEGATVRTSRCICPPDPDAFPWDEPGYGVDVSALVGAPVAPSAEDLAACLSGVAGEPIEVRDVRIGGGVLHCVLTMRRDLAEDLGLAPVSGVEAVRDALLARLKDEPEGAG